MTTIKTLDKEAFYNPLTEHYYAPNACTPDYAADYDISRMIRWTISTLAFGWSEELYGKPGFIEFCKYLQMEYLEHMLSVVSLLEENDVRQELREFRDDEDATFLEIEDTDHSSLEWGDERGETKDCPHLIVGSGSEFRKPDHGGKFCVMTDVCSLHGEQRTVWFEPSDDVQFREAVRTMKREIKKAQQELKQFWAEYEKLYPLTKEPEEWRG